ncbi:molybdate ABC transporter substrate-binding protein [Yersinia enterocolitica]|uniref:Molybdate-binding periplasmic protein n=1 Tax=Yersinia enterocolitica serotype O:8 / biotype 1B (strain NCTC 13174 / 8081) TaxID=393305 RepID=A1JS38_YERE8|nr:molybdate ABC transporter substrate-binding protein [Yersinia enterocolitica]AJJ22800.1 molybdate ABC transporter, periplasmic molybdate-binding protein [Yersinia enterocolitica]CAL12951.1 molybdate-binding periplasmic protein precursor [Yersinia enterocolitica subsp. enterocolitica 8081]HDL8282466.1 molybdate ABC transporter substrate-binding protein [Yersinia enterocolitica]HDM8291914.1 molybdate ABC transporter substrate-binding protein [Yersinia enterocolitica]HDM8293931.1 molybdate ABC
MKNQYGKVNKWVASAALLVAFSSSAMAADITVFAAASLTNALQDIAAQYKKEKQVDVVASYASSSTLARQIEQGAPADLFISADQQWMDYAIDKQQMVANTRYTLLGNELVLIAPKDSKITKVEIDKKTDWKKLLEGGRLAVGDPDHVPAGIYAKESLENLGAWATLAPEMARANNVRSAMALVERAEAPLGIVYGSDAIASDKVKVVGGFPESSHKPVEYPMAIVKGHENPTVTAFYDYLKSPAAAVIFEKYGFTTR